MKFVAYRTYSDELGIFNLSRIQSFSASGGSVFLSCEGDKHMTLPLQQDRLREIMRAEEKPGDVWLTLKEIICCAARKTYIPEGPPITMGTFSGKPDMDKICYMDGGKVYQLLQRDGKGGAVVQPVKVKEIKDEVGVHDVDMKASLIEALIFSKDLRKGQLFASAKLYDRKIETHLSGDFSAMLPFVVPADENVARSAKQGFEKRIVENAIVRLG